MTCFLRAACNLLALVRRRVNKNSSKLHVIWENRSYYNSYLRYEVTVWKRRITSIDTSHIRWYERFLTLQVSQGWFLRSNKICHKIHIRAVDASSFYIQNSPNSYNPWWTTEIVCHRALECKVWIWFSWTWAPLPQQAVLQLLTPHSLSAPHFHLLRPFNNHGINSVSQPWNCTDSRFTTTFLPYNLCRT